MSSSEPTVIPAPLSQGAGYGVVVGLGVAYAIGMHPDMLVRWIVHIPLTSPGMTLVTRSLRKTFGENNKTTET